LEQRESVEDVVEKGVGFCGGDFDRLISLVDRLRGDGGCPWDQAQTPDTLKVYLIEEAYEVLEALESADTQNVCSELGDLLFQIAFLARVFTETGDFTMGDVLRKITEKMVRRHPHVFGNDKVSSPEEVRHLWHEIKAAEDKGCNRVPQSCLDSVPEKLPALMRAYRLGERAASVGLEWPDMETAVSEVEGALAQFRDALQRDDEKKPAQELGNLLFAVVGMSRFIGIHPETALTKTISAFVKRTQEIEETFRKQGRTMESASSEEMAHMWDRLIRDMAEMKDQNVS
jgi:MazG family protein